MRINLVQPLLQGNQTQAEKNRKILSDHSTLALNLISSPGAGKTTFLEAWIQQVKAELRIGVIQGDLATTLDAERIAACGVDVVQINTHGGCHLDADMILRAMEHLDLPRLDYLVIENVGNLVCPVEFDLGEHLRITLLSTSEGSDKPAKYPASFQRADAVILTKIDLLPYVPFDQKQFQDAMRELNPQAPILPISALTGEGLIPWSQWLTTQARKWQENGSRSGESSRG